VYESEWAGGMWGEIRTNERKLERCNALTGLELLKTRSNFDSCGQNCPAYYAGYHPPALVDNPKCIEVHAMSGHACSATYTQGHSGFSG